MNRWIISMRKMFGINTKSNKRKVTSTKRRQPISFEHLEDRTVPATITVTSLADNLTTGGGITLREALLAAQTDTSVDGSTAGSGADIITFSPGLTGAIKLSIIGDTTNGPSAFRITTPITINGFNGGSGITIERGDGVVALRLFDVAQTGNLTLQGLTLANGLVQGVGSGAGMGGAILNGGVLNVVQSLLTDNSALGGLDDGAGLGGAIYNTGTAAITNTTIAFNEAVGEGLGDSLGGGIFNHNGVLNILSSTLSGNTAPDGGQNVLNLGDGLLGISSTLINNSILGQTEDSVTDFLSQTIGLGTALSSGVGNLIVNPGNFLGTAISGVDPLLGELTDNGGPTLSLLPGLPAIDQGVTSLLGGLLTDQTGLVPRLLGSVIDIGALEVGNGSVRSVTSTTPDGTYGIGSTINVTVNFSRPVTLTGGNLIVNLSSGGTVTIPPFSSATSASGIYTITAGQNSSDLDSTSIAVSGNATLKDESGNDVSLAIPVGGSLANSTSITVNTTTDGPAIRSITSTSANGTYGVGNVINVTVNFTRPVTLAGGNLKVYLDSGGIVTIGAFSNATSASGTYTVAAGQNSADLNATGLIQSAGSTLKDSSGNNASLAIPVGQSLADLKNIVVSTNGLDISPPTVTISAPSVAKTGHGPVTFTITYSDGNFSKSTLTAADVTLNKTGNASGKVAVVTGNGNTRTVVISNINGNGTLGISLAAQTAQDTEGNQSAAAGPSSTVTVTNTPIFAIGGSNGVVRIVNAATGAVISRIRPLDVAGVSAYMGLVQVALGDLNGDGTPDLFVAPAQAAGVAGLHPSKAGKVFVYDGTSLGQGLTPAPFRTMTPFWYHEGPDRQNRVYRNGLNIAVGDVNGDGIVDLVAGTQSRTADLEHGRMTVISGATTPAFDARIGRMIAPFGPRYQKGVVVAAGDLDGTLNANGLPQVEIAISSADPNLAARFRAYQLSGSDFRELHLSGTGGALTPFVGISGPRGEPLGRDPHIAFIDQNGDGKAELVLSVLDPYSTPGYTHVRIAAFRVNTTTGRSAPISTGSGPSRSFVIRNHVTSNAITHVDLNGDGSRDLALITRSSATGVLYLNPLTRTLVPGGLNLPVAFGGVSIDGI